MRRIYGTVDVLLGRLPAPTIMATAHYEPAMSLFLSLYAVISRFANSVASPHVCMQNSAYLTAHNFPSQFCVFCRNTVQLTQDFPAASYELSSEFVGHPKW